MSAHGPMVTGMFGQRDWRQKFEEIQPAQAVERVFGRAWGSVVPTSTSNGPDQTALGTQRMSKSRSKPEP
jgi:hypothetical protein